MRGEYSTKQKRGILNFLKEHELENFSVDDLVFHLEQEGDKIGRSTVYRHLEALAEQGSVRKYQNAQGMTQYQHVSDDGRCDRHFHMLCKNCGRLWHVDCEWMESLEKHISEEHGFTLDPRDTMLVGICARCAGKEEKNHGADHDEGRHHCL